MNLFHIKEHFSSYIIILGLKYSKKHHPIWNSLISVKWERRQICEIKFQQNKSSTKLVFTFDCGFLWKHLGSIFKVSALQIFKKQMFQTHISKVHTNVV